MTFSVNPVDAVKEIIRLVSGAGLSQDVITLMEKKLVLLTDELALSQQREAKLKLENSQLRQQLQNSQPSVSPFKEFEGVLWKRNGNNFGKAPFCPQCSDHPIMYGMPPDGDPFIWKCSKCQFQANFAGRPKI